MSFYLLVKNHTRWTTRSHFRVRTGPGKSGKSWNFNNGIFQDWKVLERGHWSRKFLETDLLNSTTKYEVYGRQ